MIEKGFVTFDTEDIATLASFFEMLATFDFEERLPTNIDVPN